MDKRASDAEELSEGGLRIIGTVRRRWRRPVGDDANRRVKIIYDIIHGTNVFLLTQWQGDDSTLFPIGGSIDMPVKVNAYIRRGNHAMYELVLDDGSDAMMGEAF